MLTLQSNAVLASLAHQTAAQIDALTEKRVRQVVDAFRKRRERRWNKVLGRRGDGSVIRPIPTTGRFRFAPLLDAAHLALLRSRVRAQVVAEVSCESCGADARASFVYNPGTVTGYWPATLCAACERSLNSAACQRDLLAQEIEKAESKAGWSAAA